MSEFENEIRRLAPLLNELEKSDQATFEYQGVSDALVWSDELPENPISYEMAIRYLLQYRTSVIAGEPIEQIAPYWEMAKEAFPNWPGFSAERCQPSESLASRVREMRAELETFLDEEEAI